MSGFARSDTSLLGRWWWTVDRWTLIALLLLMGVGAILVLAASPAVAERLDLPTFSLAKRQLVVLPAALALMLAVSLFSPRQVRRFAVLGTAAAFVGLILTLFIGSEIKGATRWISLAGFSIQPSEFMKPCFAVLIAALFAAGKAREDFPGTAIAIGLFLAVAGLLVLQPDVGQTVMLAAIFGSEFFLAGLPMILVIGAGLVAVAALVGAYFLLPHVTERIDAFLNPEVGDHYQVERSIEAFMNGGLLGTGPGEGTIKQVLPDAHSDFIFAVAGEEFGMLVCLAIVLLFAFVVLRGFVKLLNETSLFVLLAASGLLTQFGLQALINMASSLRLMPTKGMTLPFISYGGSSLLALALGMGMLLALTRRRVDRGESL
ncbi:MAG: putative lipid II flippase FtsW [Rhodovibrionaceae bacterium]